MSSYNDIEFILDLEVDEFMGIVENAIQKEEKELKDKQEELLLHRWGYELRFMENPIQFEEYKKLATGKKVYNKAKSNVDNKELIEKINRIKELDQKGNKSEVIDYETL